MGADEIFHLGGEGGDCTDRATSRVPGGRQRGPNDTWMVPDSMYRENLGVKIRKMSPHVTAVTTRSEDRGSASGIEGSSAGSRAVLALRDGRNHDYSTVQEVMSTL